MKGLLDTFRNIFRIPELKARILFTLVLLGVYRLVSFVTLPGVNATALQQQFSTTQGEGILGFLNTFVGGAFGRGSIVALGIMPYISASIIIQLLGVALPHIQKLQKEGESGMRKINQYTRYLTVLITMGQAAAYITNLRTQFASAIIADPVLFTFTTVVVLTAGTLFLVWLGEQITERGLGNGTSLIIAIGIIAELPQALLNEATTNAPLVFFLEVVALAFVTVLVILLTQGVRKVPVNYARRMVGNKMMGGMTSTARQYIPLKLNAAGVMPIIFAQSLMFLPATVAQFFPESGFWIATGTAFADFTGFWYNLVFALMIVVFTYLYTAIAYNPNDIADQLKRSGGFIPGVKPGKKTSEHLDTIMTRITLPGSLFLALVAILPAFASAAGVSSQFAQFFGGTSLLIMIGVVLDTLQQVNSHLLNKRYDGLMRSGRVQQGRATTLGATA
ncbi:MAG: preprotein translocase subunit SecY [Bacteroidia bacterium]|nr:preprotein translocase subunit SecY [Bacteroidia bacterium]